MNKIKNKIKEIYIFIRFGEITERVVGTVYYGLSSEIEYLDRKGRVVGFWCCGYFDPSYPYRG